MTQRTIQSSTLWGVCLSVALLLAAVVLMVAPAAVAGAGTTCLTDFFSAQDAATLKKSVLSLQKKEGLFGSSQDLSDSFYAVSVLAGLGGKVGEVPHKDLLCQQGKNALAAARSSADLKDIFFAAHLVEKLNCGEKVKKEVVSSLESAAVTGTLEDIHAALSTLALLKRNKHAQFDESDLPSVLEKILDLLDVDASFKNMEDDTEGSPLYAGLAYHSLAILFSEFGLSPDQEGSKLSTLVESVSDLFLLAEEEEGILEFIHPQDPLANLRATSLVWTGLNALAAALPDAELAPSAAQVVGMAEYFVQHKHASNLQDAHFVLEAVNLMASNKFKLQPLALTLPTSSLLTTSKGEEGHVKVQITDIQGNFATKARVYIVKAFPVNEGTNIVAMNQELLPVSDKDPKNTAYSFNFLATKPNTGFYAMELSVSPVNASGQTTKDSPYITSNKVVRSLKVITPITISDFVLKVVESKEEEDQSTDPSTEYPNKMDDTLQATVFQSIFFSFRVKNQVSGRNLAAHQVFAIFTNAETQEEAVFIVPRVGNKHRLSLSVKENAKIFGRSGKYLVALVVGDPFAHNPIHWDVASVYLNFGALAHKESKKETYYHGPLPIIEHQFRQAEKRPPAEVSMVFTGLVLSPFLVLLIGLLFLGANLRNFPSGVSSVYALGFQGCLAALVGLFALYWLYLNMLQTLGYLALLAVPTIFFGNRALAALAAHDKQE